MRELFALIRSFVYATAFCSAWAWLALQVRPLDSTIAIAIPAAAAWPGLGLIALGGAIALWCVVCFSLVGKGTPAPFDAPREFVAVGPYRYVRNPMYIGGIAALAGFALLLRSPAMLLFCLVPIACAQAMVVLHEEPRLEREFGISYLDYMRTVSRWVPRVGTRRR